MKTTWHQQRPRVAARLNRGLGEGGAGVSRPGRFLATPITFLLAVLIAGGMFVLAATRGPAVAIGVGVFVAALVWAFTSESGGIYCLILAALGEGVYKAMSPNMVTMLIKDVFLGIMWLRLLWVSQRERDFAWLRQPFTAIAICFTAYCVAQVFAPTTRSVLLAVAGLRAWVLWMPVYFPAYHYFINLGRINRFVAVLVLIMLPPSIYGIVQGNIGYEHTRILPDFYQYAKSYQSDYYPILAGKRGAEAHDSTFEAAFKPVMNVRASSIHTSPGSFGALCAILILASLGYAAYAPQNRWRVWGIVSGLAAAGGLLASGSRGPMMGLVVGLVAMLLVARRRAVLVVGVIVIAFVSAHYLKDIVGGGALRLEHRLSLPIVLERVLMPMSRGLELGFKHPFGMGIATGTGMGRLFYKAELQQAEGTAWVENDFGRALTELGFVGGALWLLMVLGILWSCLKAVRRTGTSREGLLAAGLFGAMMSVFAQLSIGTALYGANSGLYFWVFAAMIVRLAEHVAARRPETGEEAPAPLAATGSLGTGPGPGLWRQPGQPLRLPRPAVPPGRLERGPSGPAAEGGPPHDYRRAPGAPLGPRPGAPREARPTQEAGES
jgi:hypothetical protein